MQPMDEIYQKYARTVYRYLLSRTRDEDLAEELDRSHSVIESAEDQVIGSMKYVELMKSLHVCPEPFREILYMRIFGNLSFKEIGEIMGKTENWARVTYYRGKEKLREGLRKDEE